MRKIIYLILVIFFCNIIFTAAASINIFGDTTSRGNLTYTKSESKFVNISIPKTAYIYSSTIQFLAYNVSNYLRNETDGNVWSYENGTYNNVTTDFDYINDGDRGTAIYTGFNGVAGTTGNDAMYIYENFTIMNGTSEANITLIYGLNSDDSCISYMQLSCYSAGWQTVYTDTDDIPIITRTVTLPNECLGNDTLQVRIASIMRDPAPTPSCDGSDSMDFEFREAEIFWSNYIFPSNVSVRINNTIIYQNITNGISNFNGSIIIDLNSTILNQEINRCVGTFCNITLNATSESVGIIEYSNLDIRYIAEIINLTFFDEILSNESNFFSGKNIYVEISHENLSQNYTVNSGKINLDLNYTGEYRISYYSDEYTLRDYYIDLTGNTINHYQLYLLSSGNSTDTTITIEDENARAVESAIIKVLRYYVQSNSYIITAMAKTDENGQARINLEHYNAFYYFVVEKNNIQLTSTTPARIINNELTYSVILTEDVLESKNKLHLIYNTLDYINSSQQFRFTYNDASGILEEACLKVERVTLKDKTEICNTCQNSLSGTIICSINTTIPGTYRGYGIIETTTTSSTYLVAVLDVLSNVAIQTYGTLGVYLTAYLIMGLALLGSPLPYVSIILAIVGLIFSAMTGILGIGYVALTSLIIIASLILYFVKR